MEPIQKISILQIKKHYRPTKALGQGNSGSVYAYLHQDTQQQYALKIIKSNNPHKRMDALNQIQIMKKLDHRNIVKIFKYYDETYCTKSNSRQYETGLLLERGLGSLQHCIKDRSYEYDFQDIIQFIVKFIELGAYLQSKQIVHRDIKPGNIIIFNKKLKFKLGDFGLSCYAFERPNGFAGTPAYCSPLLTRFYKEGDHKQKPNSNPYKDDVYSFAVTSKEVIKYRYHLDDSPKEITTLLDEMLKHDERERLTFSSLLHHEIVQKYLNLQNKSEMPLTSNSNIFKDIQLNRNPQIIETFTKKKIAQKEYTQLNHHTEKSKKVKNQVNYTNVCKGIRTICHIDDLYILCGTDKGQVYVINRENDEIAQLTLRHEYYIAKIALDLEGNVWIAGGDGKVEFISKEKLINYIRYHKEVDIVRKFSFFGPERQIITIKVNIPFQEMTEITDCEDEKYISELYCQDEDHYVIGYCSGAIKVKWGKNEPAKIYQIHIHPITSIKVNDNVIYSSDFGGMVKLYSLSKRIIEKMYYKFNEELIDFSVNNVQHGKNIEGLTCKGHIQTINLYKSSRTTFNAQIPVKNIIAATFTDRQYYLLTADGQIYFKNIFFLKAESQSNFSQNWICLLQSSETELMIASQQGEVCVITLQN